MTERGQGTPGAHVGHEHLKVADLDRAIAFYRDVIGMRVMLRWGASAAFLSFDDYHHHLGLNTWESKDGAPPPKGHTGLYHIAFLFPDRKALGAVIDRVQSAGYKLTGAADHGVSEAVYLDDPDGNGLELYRDRPQSEWKMTDEGFVEMVNSPLDVAALVSEARARTGTFLARSAFAQRDLHILDLVDHLAISLDNAVGDAHGQTACLHRFGEIHVIGQHLAIGPDHAF